MKTSHLSTKLFLTEESTLEPNDLIPVFHRWIREKTLSDELLIDVADYRHVPDGPYIMLIAHEAHYALDGAAGRDGLAFYKKRDPLTEVKTAIRNALRDSIRAALLLEKDSELEGKVQFKHDEIQVRFLNRLTAPNDKSTCEQVEPALRELLAEIGLPEVTFEHNLDRPREALTIQVKAISDSPSLGALLEAL